MSYRRAFDNIFIEGAIKTVAEVGIENMRTKHVAEYAGFSEATMFRMFPTKEALLREAFLYTDKQVSKILTQSAFIRNPGDTPFELGLHSMWRKVYRYLINNKDETIFLIRYRYSSLYTNEVRSMRQAYNGGFDEAYAIFEKHLGRVADAYRGFLINYIFEMTLCFAEKIINGKVEDNQDTEYSIWMAIISAVKTWTQWRGDNKHDEQAELAQLA